MAAASVAQLEECLTRNQNPSVCGCDHLPFVVHQAAPQCSALLLQHRQGDLEVQHRGGQDEQHPHHPHQDHHVLYRVHLLQTEVLESGSIRVSETLQGGVPVTAKVVICQYGDCCGCIGIVRGIDEEDPAVVGWHERLRDNEPTAKSANGGKDGTEAVSLLRVGDCEEEEEGEPALVDQEEG